MEHHDPDYQKKKDYLSRWLPIRSRMNNVELRLRELAIDDGVHSSVPKSAVVMMTSDEYETRTEKAEILQQRLDHLSTQGKQIRLEIYHVLDELDSATEANVLERYFIDGLTQYAIANRLHYSYRWTARLYTNGIKHITLPD